MPKKIDEAEIKKECPSCGLGVSLESKVCEFCGWDFAEEDEWILQIEKLERDLMQEKQKFEPGSVDEKIESTLHAPKASAKEAAKPAPRPAAEPAPKEAPPPAKRGRVVEAQKPVPEPIPEVQRPPPARIQPAKPIVSKPPPAKAPEVVKEKPVVSARPPPPEPVLSKPQEKPVTKPAVQAQPRPVVAKAPEPAPAPVESSGVRRVRVVKSVPAQEAGETPAPKKRLVRKVKGKS